jgi:hypothetical protein
VTEAAIALRERVDRARIAVSADALAVAGVAVVTLLLAVLTWRTWGDLDSDTGYDMVAAARVAAGAIPYRDFTYYYGPLAPELYGFAALIAGAGVWTSVAVGFAITLGIIAATFVLGRVIAGALGAFLAGSIAAAVAFIPDNYSYVVPHTADATLGMLLLLLALIGVWRYADTGHSRWLLEVGCCLGLLLLTKVEPAAAGIAMATLWLILRSRAGASLRREAPLVGVPAILIPAVVYGAFLTVVSFHRLVFENLYPVDFFRAAGDTLIKARMPMTVSSFAHLVEKAILYAIGVAALLALAKGIERGGRLRTAILAGLTLAAILATGAAVASPEAVRYRLQYAWGWIPLVAIVVTAYLIRGALRARRDWSAREQLELAAAVALTILAASTYGGFFPNAPNEQLAAYYMPLAALLVVRLHLRSFAPTKAAFRLGAAWVLLLASASTALTLKDARADSAVVHGPGGSLAQTPKEAELYQGALGWIVRETRPGEPIFVAPMMTGVYALADRRSPVREISMLPGALPSISDEQQAIAALERAKVRLVITDDRKWPGYGQGAFGVTFDRVLAEWIQTNFRRVATLHADGWESIEGVRAPRNVVIWLREDK